VRIVLVSEIIYSVQLGNEQESLEEESLVVNESPPLEASECRLGERSKAMAGSIAEGRTIISPSKNSFLLPPIL
jgi:hypothetical protein